MTTVFTSAVMTLLISAVGLPVTISAQEAAADCAPADELSFICGMEKPEDLVGLSGGDWIIASGMAPKSGLHLIDADFKTSERWIAPEATAQAPFDACPSQPHPDEMQMHGLNLRDHGDGHATLYAVNHGGTEALTSPGKGHDREAIEVFNINYASDKPEITWQGCLLMPDDLVPNSVASGPNGEVYVTVLLHPEMVMQDIWDRKPTGAVYMWTPDTAKFIKIEGTELNANNGIEVSADGQVLYVNSLDRVTKFTATNPAKTLDTVQLKNGFADNIHWVDGRLLVAGGRTDLCPPVAADIPCTAGYYVSELDPETMTLATVVEGAANDAFDGTSVGIVVDDTVWLGTYLDNKVAYRPLH
jgi:hypothetical protein